MAEQSMRIIATYSGSSPSGAARIVKVRYESDLRKYVCKVHDAGEYRAGLDYFTDDKADALATARDMVGDPACGKIALSPLESLLPGMPVKTEESA